MSDIPCPCDDTGHDEDSSQSIPCSGKECPDGCPDCSCCPGMGVAIVDGRESSPMPSGVLMTFVQQDDPALGFYRGVFRPPRSLS
ncbi:MAG: hypothetical protein GY854_16665 [Deltaproteobacteria bacterium]|nr:hypothetical protein [Deltaproteobacteria bacterium]